MTKCRQPKRFSSMDLCELVTSDIMTKMDMFLSKIVSRKYSSITITMYVSMACVKSLRFYYAESWCQSNCTYFMHLQISPSELEGIVGKHPSVNEVCVVGIPDPAGGGDIPRAFITVKGNPPTTITEEIQRFTNGLEYILYIFLIDSNYIKK